MEGLQFTNRPAVVGAIHVGALPGTPRSSQKLDEIIKKVVSEAAIYSKAKVDGVIVENMHDRPYLKGAEVGSDTVAMMTRVSTEVRASLACPCGVQILAGANEAALAVAMASDFQFIRAEGFVYAHVADEGWIEGCAARLLRERARLRAEHIAVWTDIKKKHSAHAVTADVSLAETAQAAAYNLSDALIVTGSHTGEPARVSDLEEIQNEVPDLPVYVGSGMTTGNLQDFRRATGFIVGSSFKEGGYWENTLSYERVAAFVEAARTL